MESLAEENTFLRESSDLQDLFGEKRGICTCSALGLTSQGFLSPHPSPAQSGWIGQDRHSTIGSVFFARRDSPQRALLVGSICIGHLITISLPLACQATYPPGQDDTSLRPPKV
jgi:hypothetical protein